MAGCGDDRLLVIGAWLGDQGPTDNDDDGTSMGTGGASSAGGTSSTGGSTSIGGTSSNGGSTSIGGTSSIGGSTSIGGTSSTGGSTSSGTGGTSSDAGTDPDVAEPTTLAEGDFGALALGDGSLFVVDQAGASLARLSTAGGPLVAISPPLTLLPHRLVADGSSLYAALFLRPGRTELWRVPSSGGSFDMALGGELLGELPSVAAMGVNAGDVVSLEARPTPSTVDLEISRTDKAGAGAVVVTSVELLFSSAFAVDDAAAFVVRGGDEQDIVRVELASGAVTSLADALPGESLRDLAAGEDALYFASSTRVGSTPKAGGEARTLSATPAYRVLASEDYVYFATAGDAFCEAGSTLYRAPVSGGAAEYLVDEPVPGCIRELLGDASGLYWVTGDSSRVRAFRLP